MEKNLTLPQGKNSMASAAQALAGVATQVAIMARMPMEALRKYYSDVLDEEVSMARTVRLVHAQVAFLAAVAPVGLPLALRAAFCAWFLLAVLKCKE